MAVVYDLGAAGIIDIVTALEDFAVPIFICPDSGHEEYPTDLMSEFGVLCDIRGMDFTDAVERIRELSPEGIVTYSDYQLELTSRLAAELGLLFHTPAVVQGLTRKSVQRQLLNASGASAVSSELVTDRHSLLDAFARTGGPAVLKPDVGTGSRSTYRIHDVQDAEHAAAEVFPNRAESGAHESFVLEAEIPSSPTENPWADYVSVDSAVFHDRIEHMAILGKFPLAEPYRETGSFFPAHLPPHTAAAVTSLVSRAIRGLGIRLGVCHTEVKLSPDGPQIIEVNGRLGGRVNELVRQTGGPSLVRLAVELALCRSAPATPRMVDAWDPSCIAFLYAKPPPSEAKRLLTLRGVEQLRDSPEISRVTVEYEEAATLDWRQGRLANVYVCYGEVGTHARLFQLVSEINRTVSLSFEH
ncbi:hypothetical protein OG930_32770 [Streptomyces sp. NBC_01799]|uniref:ATP-grasp domain-containing protein n=1 Tax=Streptomyces sp. NBC_01800 TaxID=2975945 RepID=UPI002DDC2231|nr:hypothetical protein [Streptomyces sp. NBC_01800]WSA71472.1 hypothetical protein OIE65_33390 [Streptomyces sp. NBC_01800]WSA79984.1 hypothetical protein OG930_32770 [Streptomyces sp. NBC_01799]